MLERIEKSRGNDRGRTDLKRLQRVTGRGEPTRAPDGSATCNRGRPETNFGEKRNPDGQGFATFGQVVKGMDMVRKVQASPANGQRLTPVVGIVRATLLN